MKKTKIISCCYCGARSTLDIGHGARVRLVCDTCGAPIRRMEKLRDEDRPPRDHHVGAPRHAASKPKKPSRPKRADHRPRKAKRRRSLLSSLIDDVWDEIEDIFD